MNSFVPIVNLPLMLVRSTDWTYCAIYEPETIVQRSPFRLDCCSVYFQCGWIKKEVVPLINFLAMRIENEICHLITDYRKFRDRPSESWHQVAETARISHYSQQNTQSF